MKIFCLPIRFDPAIQGSRSEKIQGFIDEMAGIFFEDRTDVNIHRSTLRYVQNLNLQSELISKDILEKLNNHGSFDSLIIDLCGPNYRGTAYPTANIGVCRAISELCKNNNLHQSLCLMPGTFSEVSAEANTIIKCVKEHKTRFAFSNGEVLRFSENEDGYERVDNEAVRSAFISSAESLSESISRKMIRQPGYFIFAEDQPSYPFSYDFSEAQTEIIEAGRLYIEHFTKNNPNTTFTIAYWGDQLWFSRAMSALSNVLKGKFSFKEINSRESICVDEDYILFIPIYRTGAELISWINSQERTPLQVWTIAHLAEEEQLKEKTETHSLSDVELRIISQVTLEDEHPRTRKIWSELELRNYILDKSNEYTFNSIEAWAMIVDSGFCKEDYGPDNLIPVIPNNTELIQKNKNYIQKKLFNRCEDILGSPLRADFIFVTIEEPGAKEFFNSLGLKQDFRCVTVSRELLKFAAEEQYNLESIINLTDKYFATEYNGLVETLERLRHTFTLNEKEPIDAISLDEFTLSGESIQLINGFCVMCNISHKSHINLFNFIEQGATSNPTQYSLYHLPWAEGRV